MSIKRQLMHVQFIRDPKKKTSYIYFIEKQKLPNGDIKKVVITEKDPIYRFYINEQFVNDTENAVNFIEKEKVKPVDVPYSKLYNEVLNLVIKNEDIRDELLGSDYSVKQSTAINNNNCHLIDLNIVDYKIREYLERYNNELDVIPLRKVFLDIEADISDYDDFPHPEIAPCPINMFSYLDNEEMILYCGILYDENNESQLEFLEEVLNEENNILEEIRKEEFPEVKELKLEIFFNEVELIKFVFDKIKRDKPDFVGGWNFYFDIKTFETRLEKILPKYNKENSTNFTKYDIMCSPELSPYIHIEDDNFNTEINKKKAKLSISSTSQFVDMQYCYAVIRTGMGKKDSWSLDAICFEELDITKTEIENIRTEVKKNFKNFFIYSSKDSYLLYKLDAKTKDIDLLYNMGIVTYTQFTKVMTKTTSLRNLAAKALFDNGYILSNNRVKFRKYEKEKFRGAYVADPCLMDRVGISLGDLLSNLIFENVVDEDLSSMYPSIILAGNIDVSTMIGKIVDNIDPEFGAKFYAFLVEDDFSVFLNKTLNLPTSEEVLENLEDLIS